MTTKVALLAILPFATTSMLIVRVLREMVARGIDVHMTLIHGAAGAYPIDPLDDLRSAGRVIDLSCLDGSRWLETLCREIATRNVGVILQVGGTELYPFLPFLKERRGHLVLVDQLYNEVGHTARHFLVERCIDGVLVESEFMRAFVSQSTSIPNRRIWVIRNGVDVLHFRVQRTKRSDDFVVGFVGRLSEEKNPLLFLDLADRVLPRLSSVHFKMFGSGPLDKVISKRASALSSPERFAVLGHRSDVREAYEQLDLLIVPSRNDGRPVVIMEAGASGIPVIAAPVGGIPEMVIEDLNGYLIEPGDTERIFQVIERLVSEPREIARLGLSARKHAEEHFAIGAMLDAYEKTFRELCAQAAGSGCARHPATGVRSSV